MSVYLISKYRDRLKDRYHIKLTEHDTVDKLMSKVRLYKYAQENNFPIPKTFFLRSLEETQNIVGELTFPCVIKPPISADPEWEQKSKLKAYKVSTPEELIEVYKNNSELTDVLIVQEWVEGPETNLYSCNCYFDENNQPVVTFVAKKLRQWPPITGESSLGVECRDDIVLDITVNLFKSVNYQGLSYVEIKQDSRNGKYYIIEPNIGRPTGRSAIAEAAGVERARALPRTIIHTLPENNILTLLLNRFLPLRMKRDDISAQLEC
jgi:predicted ATP-grasp superfamily ATP-dependent carboligase